MKKLLSILLCCCMALSFTACSDEAKTTNGQASDELESVSKKETNKTEETEKETLEERTRQVDTENTFVFDDKKILTDGEYENLNSYTAWFSNAFKINAAVVITDDIGESEPSEYAKNYYESYFSGDGILFLINNDTNVDYLYRQGRPADFISDGAVQMLFAEISPMLALECYMEAAERVLEEAEYLLPECFSDRTGTLAAEDIKACHNILKEAAGSSTINFYYINGTGEEDISDFAKSRFDMFYSRSENVAMLVLNGKNGDSYLCVGGNMSYLDDSQDEIRASIKECYSNETGMNIKAAAEKFIEYVE